MFERAKKYALASVPAKFIIEKNDWSELWSTKHKNPLQIGLAMFGGWLYILKLIVDINTHGWNPYLINIQGLCFPIRNFLILCVAV